MKCIKFCRAILFILLALVLAIVNLNCRNYSAKDKPQFVAIVKDSIHTDGQVTYQFPNGYRVHEKKYINPFLKVMPVKMTDSNAIAIGPERLIAGVPVYTWNVQNGERSEITLPDGSRVMLDPGSTFRFSSEYNLSKREVYLEGKAIFMVKNLEATFKINLSDSISAETNSGLFTINSFKDDSAVQITSLTSVLQVEDNKSEIKLMPEKSLSLNVVTKRFQFIKKNPNKAVEWEQGFVNVEDISLRELFSELGRWYNKKVVIIGNLPPSHASGPVTVSRPIEKVLSSMSFIFHVNARLENDKIIVSPK